MESREITDFSVNYKLQTYTDIQSNGKFSHCVKDTRSPGRGPGVLHTRVTIKGKVEKLKS